MENPEKTTVLGANCRLCAFHYIAETLFDLKEDKKKYDELTSILSFLNASYVDFTIEGLSLAVCKRCYQCMIKIFEFLCKVQNAQHELSSLSISDEVNQPREVCTPSKEILDLFGNPINIFEVKCELPYENNFDRASEMEMKVELEGDNSENPFEKIVNEQTETQTPSNFIKAEYTNRDSEIDHNDMDKTIKTSTLIKQIPIKTNPQTEHKRKVEFKSETQISNKNIIKKSNKTKLEVTKTKKKLQKSSILKKIETDDGKTSQKLHKLQEMYDCKTRTCELCNTTFNTRQMLYYHITKQHGVQWKSKIRQRIPKDTPLTQEDLTCQYCKKVFGKIRNLRRHICSIQRKVEQLKTNNPESNIVIERTDNTNGSFIINNVEKNTHRKVEQILKTDVESESMEEVQNSNENLIINNSETKTTKNKTKTEEKQELIDPKLICDTCNREFSKIGNLVRHILTHKQFEQNLKSTEKNDLSNSSESPEKIKRNEIDLESSEELKEPYDPKLMKCDLCSKTFVNRQSLYKHKIKWHGYKTSKIRTRGVPLSQKDLTCQYCNKIFTKMNNLYAHVSLIHKRVKRHLICDQCGKTYDDKVNFRVHVKSHGDKPHVCKICSASYTDTYKLRNHLLTHFEEKHYLCHCGAKFKNNICLNSHIRNQHIRPKTFDCKYCEKRFRSKSGSIVHERTHTGDYVECTQCDMTFTSWSNCDKHMRNRHNATLAKNKLTTRGKVAIDPATGELIQVQPTDPALEEWKKQVLMAPPSKPGRKKC